MESEILFDVNGLPRHVMHPIRIREFDAFVKLFSEKMYLHIVKHCEQEPDLIVWLCLIANMNAENVVTISQAGLASELKVSQARISRAMKRLIELSFISKSENRKQQWVMVNPFFVFSGSPNNRRKALAKWNAMTQPIGGLLK